MKKIVISPHNISKHQAQNLSAVLASCNLLGLDLNKISKNLSKYEAVAGRGKILDIQIDNKNITIIDDSYNSNPISLKAGLDNLSNYSKRKGRKIAILSDMLELGEGEVKFHSDIGVYINGLNIDLVITMCDLSKNIYDNLEDTKKLGHFTDKDSLNATILNILMDGDIIMFKGSKSTLMYKVLEYLYNR
jgi:UDP-N-acetylmuramyl pentapeptide synthase